MPLPRVPAPLISAEQLRPLMGSVTLFDVRVGEAGRAAYASAHLTGAVFADLDGDLAAPVTHPEHGGRHPLPDMASWRMTLGRWGVTPDAHAVAYDDQGGANAAARLWWMLRAVGHTRVSVLDGGWQAALSEGLGTDDTIPSTADVGPYPAAQWQLPTATLEQVRTRLAGPDWTVIDVRSAARYRGEIEPIDPIAGHIPGATNVPFLENLDESGRFKTPNELRTSYASILPGGRSDSADHCVVHCGSGVTACHTLLALEHAGLSGASLYVGSWGEWCRQPGAVIAKK